MPNMEAATVAVILVEEVISWFGVPSGIHLDHLSRGSHLAIMLSAFVTQTGINICITSWWRTEHLYVRLLGSVQITWCLVERYQPHLTSCTICQLQSRTSLVTSGLGVSRRLENAHRHARDNIKAAMMRQRRNHDQKLLLQVGNSLKRVIKVYLFPGEVVWFISKVY
jgi:hypothetical protein